MSYEAWFQGLRKNPVINEMIPLELQAGLPLPVLHRERLLIYVPYYRVQPSENGVQYSDFQMELTFDAHSKRIVLVRDLRVLNGAAAKEWHETVFPTDDKLQELEYLYQDLLHQLDKIDQEYRQSKTVSAQRLSKYADQLAEGLLYPELVKQYAEVTL